MKDSFWKIARGILMIWGVVSLIFVIACTILFGIMVYQFGHEARVRNDTVSPKQAHEILASCRLDNQQIIKVVHSYLSDRSFTGDHLDVYAIRIAPINPAKLKTHESDLTRGWYRCDQLPQMLKTAVDFVNVWGGEAPKWFPKVSDLETPAFYVYPGIIYTSGLRPYSMRLTFLRPADGMIFCIDCKT